jgi:hypothetical protein
MKAKLFARPTFAHSCFGRNCELIYYKLMCLMLKAFSPILLPENFKLKTFHFMSPIIAEIRFSSSPLYSTASTVKTIGFGESHKVHTCRLLESSC